MTKDRAVASLVGLAVGDALGTTIEFSDRDTYPPVNDMVGGGPFELNPGEWTDDTSMALCLAESLIHDPKLDLDDLFSRFLLWRDHGVNSVNGHCFDIGHTTTNGISAYYFHHTVVNNTEDSDSGNGGIMRLAPAAIVGWQDATVAKDLAVRSSATTHGSEQCIAAAEFLAEYLVNLYAGNDVRPAATHSSIKQIATDDYTKVDREYIKSTGYVIHTLEAAVWAVANTDSFKDAVLLAVNLGDDADTVGAVTGQIAGAKYGLDNIPESWMNKLYERDRIVDLASSLYSKLY
jgi:ADP-ribosyl-[dinitrogen reductase] hydrolase